MDAQNMASLISSVGFPVVVAGYLIMRMDATMDRLAAEITRFSVLLDERLPHFCDGARRENKKDV